MTLYLTLPRSRDRYMSIIANKVTVKTNSTLEGATMETSLLFAIIAIQVVSTAVTITYHQTVVAILKPMAMFHAIQTLQEVEGILSQSPQTAKDEQDTGPTKH